MRTPNIAVFLKRNFAMNFQNSWRGYTNAVASGTGGIYVAMKACEIPENSMS